jgi:hypothetical protein
MTTALFTPAKLDEMAARMQAWADDCKFYDYRFFVVQDADFAHLKACYMEPDIVTGKQEEQTTRKWRLSVHMTKSEFVQTVFKCCLTSMEHRTREHFRYRGKAVFGPHFNVDALWDMCAAKQYDYRS